jgi:hypothetical protein
MKEVFAQSFLFCFLMGGLHSLTAEQLPPGALVYRNPDGTHLGLPWEIQEHGPQNFQIELQQGILMELILESQLENGEWLREAIPFSQEQGVIRFFSRTACRESSDPPFSFTRSGHPPPGAFGHSAS